MREKITLIRGYLRYLAAICNWVASVIALETFPKKSDYIVEPVGHQPGKPVDAEVTVRGDQSSNGQAVDGSVKV